MDYGKFVDGLIIIVLGALILADGVLGSTGLEDMELFSLPVFKLAVRFIALVLSASFLEKAGNNLSFPLRTQMPNPQSHTPSWTRLYHLSVSTYPYPPIRIIRARV